jgi:hypothetical protein
MAAPLVQAPAEKLQLLARLREQKAALDGQRLAELNVFSIIGYQPNCKEQYKVRKAVAARLSLPDPFDARVTEAAQDSLPPACGQCPQELFHAATEFDVLYGGAAGGGKSIALVAEGLKWCARYPGLRVLLVRRSYDELEESIFPALRKFGNGQPLGARLNKVTRELTFPNGSIFRFRYLETVDDAARRQGGEANLLLVDELTLLQPGIVDFLKFERLRSGAGQPVIGVRSTANPGGISHASVKSRYIEATDYGRKVVTDDHGLTVRFVPSRATDNFHIDPGYLKRLDAIPDPSRRAAMRDGDWDQFAGMMFPEFSEERHIVEPMPLPASWKRYNGVDWGHARPWFVGWNAIDEDGRVWVYREIYETRVGETEQARRILEAEAEGEHIIARFADDAMWATRGDSKPIAHIYAEEGVHLTPAGKGPGSRIQGWQRWHTYLAERPACPMHRAKGWATCPGIHIFNTCPNLKAELRSLPHATTGNPEDADPNAPDHAMDGERYFLMNIGGGATFYSSPAPSAPLGAEVLTPMGPWGVREDQAAAAKRDPDSRQGATQTWEQALAAMSR